MVEAHLSENWEKSSFVSWSHLSETRTFQSQQEAFKIFLKWTQNTNTSTETEVSSSCILWGVQGFLQFTDSTFLKHSLYTHKQASTHWKHHQFLTKAANNPIRWTLTLVRLAVPDNTRNKCFCCSRYSPCRRYGLCRWVCTRQFHLFPRVAVWPHHIPTTRPDSQGQHTETSQASTNLCTRPCTAIGKGITL